MPSVPFFVSHRATAGLLACAILAGCGEQAPPEPQHPRVRVATVSIVDYAADASITGDIQARVQTDLSFRIGGKIVERLVDVGDRVEAEQVLARLDPQDQRNAVRSAEAAAEAARGQLKLSAANLWRQQQLLPKGYTSRSEYDSALASERSARNSLAAAEAQLADAREQSGYTELRAEAAGLITARQAEVGQVVQATAPVFSLARDGERDAVFNVYESLLAAPSGQRLQVTLLEDPTVSAEGTVREVTPTVSARSGTVQVKVSLEQAPPAMTLGAAVSAQVRNPATRSVELPWSALTKAEREPAVWRLDAEGKVALHPVRVGRYLTDKVIISDGLDDGDRVVVAGGQLLHPGQRVEIATDRSAGEQP
ncbi:efflux RND transporter periplasmic adaptor subunit [Phytopseudomonas dryadis]|uniref:Efflux RND transporter periplasmic adaptor subunit n=1 Tax=Phytopseudomonas dryadis TaxID=2487520 RepID=A0A4Q9R3X4_9GAMM|nr:efflux RND transporter periplasmic adaptor subunit [Pseudomonas dryadis]TBU92795.1 efflux RND transporter periplasmic adaptor subunit [Pseudomonas dryadis]